MHTEWFIWCLVQSEFGFFLSNDEFDSYCRFPFSHWKALKGSFSFVDVYVYVSVVINNTL